MLEWYSGYNAALFMLLFAMLALYSIFAELRLIYWKERIPLVENSLSSFFAKIINGIYNKRISTLGYYAYNMALISGMFFFLLFIKISAVVTILMIAIAGKTVSELYGIIIKLTKSAAAKGYDIETFFNLMAERIMLQDKLFSFFKNGVDSFPVFKVQEYDKYAGFIRSLENQAIAPMSREEFERMNVHFNANKIGAVATTESWEGNVVVLTEDNRGTLDVYRYAFEINPSFAKLDEPVPIFFDKDIFQKKKEIGIVYERFAETSIIFTIMSIMAL